MVFKHSDLCRSITRENHPHVVMFRDIPGICLLLRMVLPFMVHDAGSRYNYAVKHIRDDTKVQRLP